MLTLYQETHLVVSAVAYFHDHLIPIHYYGMFFAFFVGCTL